MNDVVTLEQVQALAAQLPPVDQRRLAEKILEGLAGAPAAEEAGPRYDWMAVRGIAPNLLEGEDAQEWVSRSRRESDEQREKQWRRPS